MSSRVFLVGLCGQPPRGSRENAFYSLEIRCVQPAIMSAGAKLVHSVPRERSLRRSKSNPPPEVGFVSEVALQARFMNSGGMFEVEFY
jgi:hypothetical protein